MTHYVEFNVSGYPELEKKIDALGSSFEGHLIPYSIKTPIDDWSESDGLMHICFIGSIDEFLIILGDVLKGQFEFSEV